MKLHLGGSTPHYKPSSIHLQDSKCRSHRVNPTNIQKGAVYTVSDDTDHLDKVNMNNLLKSFVESTPTFLTGNPYLLVPHVPLPPKEAGSNATGMLGTTCIYPQNCVQGEKSALDGSWIFSPLLSLTETINKKQ